MKRRNDNVLENSRERELRKTFVGQIYCIYIMYRKRNRS